MKITSMADMANFVKVELGHPILTIDITDEQFEQAVEKAISLFNEFHRDGTKECYLPVAITEDIVTSGVIQVPDTIVEIVEMVESYNDAGGFATHEWQYLNNLFNPTKFMSLNLSQFVLMKQRIQMVRSITGTQRTDLVWEYVKYENAIQPFFAMDVNDVYVFKCYEKVDPREDKFTRAWNDPWLKEYITQLCKQSWGGNLSKFGGIATVGGETLSGDDLFNQASAELERLREELRSTHEEMPLPFVG